MSIRIFSSRIETAFAPMADQFQELWINLSLAGHLRDPLRLMVTSPRHESGCTTVAAAVAIGVARNQSGPVLLIESNMASPGLLAALGAPDQPGFAEALTQAATLEEALLASEIPNLTVLPAGAERGDPIIPNLDEMRRLFTELEQHFQVIIVDSGPTLDYPESTLIAHVVTKSLVVARAQRTLQSDLEKTAEILRASGVELIGSVLNFYKQEVPSWILPD